ncbi:transcription factor/nuclear export subunit protein 2-domain-containing protein [Corynascus novoguineensis]|uniref:Transcription factor/nuclear export subunit protein 2-domain-containing protein n=1 Tax=Corynascus novoguineensis TaxID=1126955 RepID=A0AAN7HBA7_9PEZI|nr:transcription factor/nuclear export subunit protein 2-domain-containing protein [Corynascus novoguineensis]
MIDQKSQGKQFSDVLVNLKGVRGSGIATRSSFMSLWFPAEIAKADADSDTLLEECILPCLQLSGLDAEYCFRMMKFLHEFSTPNFKLMSLYDRIFNHNRLRAIIFTCTVREAEHLARFLKLILGDLSKWHGDKTAYEKEALGLKDLQGNKTRQYLGFATAFDADGRYRLFPGINFMADKFLEQLGTITEREAASKNAPESEHGHRVDLSVTAQTTYSELQKRKSK